MLRREAAVALQEEQAAKMVLEFGSTARLGGVDTVMRVSELTTGYVKEVLRAVWMAGRPDVASAMSAAFDGAPAFDHPRTERSRSARRSRQGSPSRRIPDKEEEKEEEREEEKEEECEEENEDPPQVAQVAPMTPASYDEEQVDFSDE